GRIKLRRRPRGVDRLRNSILRGEIAGAAQRDQQAAVFDQLVELDDSWESHAAGDVVRFSVNAQARKLGTLGVSQRLTFRFDIEDDRLRASAALIRDHDDVVGVAQIALANPLLIYKVVADLEMIEGVAHPSNVLRVAPGAVDRQARQIDDVLGNIGRVGKRYSL